MNFLPSRRSAIAFVIGLFAVLCSGCALTGGGYYDDMGMGFDSYDPFGGFDPGNPFGGYDAFGNYQPYGTYQPFGTYYGGWGPGYHVGPFGQGGYAPFRGDFHPPPHAYRSAGPVHAIPSIPSRPRSGGGRPH